MQKQISNIQFITNYQSPISHYDQAKKVIEGGVKWIQYRPKEKELCEILHEGQLIAELCKQNGATFIVNDLIAVAIELDTDGVHIGKNDMMPQQARLLLGNDKIIGGTANTLNDIVNLVNSGVDYVGLGPFRFTQTKRNLSPVLGIKGYSEILSSLKKLNIDIPIIAIGGIQLSDISPIQATGVYGIAVSSLLSNASDIKSQTEKLQTLVY